MKLRQLKVVKQLADDDVMHGFVIETKGDHDQFALLERSGCLLKFNYKDLPVREDYSNPQKVLEKTGLTTTQHQFQYHLCRKKLKDLEQIFL